MLAFENRLDLAKIATRTAEGIAAWGVWEDYYRWEEVNQPTHYPPEIKDLIRSIGFSQPGGDDQGQWYE